MSLPRVAREISISKLNCLSSRVATTHSFWVAPHESTVQGYFCPILPFSPFRLSICLCLLVLPVLQMADAAESSTAGQKCQRTRPAREIRYTEPEILPQEDDAVEPIEDRDIRAHTILRFAPTTLEFRAFDKIAATQTLQHRSFDLDLLRTLGSAERLEGLLDARWRSVLGCRWAQYDELTMDFHSTLLFTAGSLTDPTTVSFSLGRQVHTMSITDFAVLTGFYTREETATPIFTESLRAVIREPHALGVTDSQLAAFWMRIADSAYSTSAVESSIRDPFLRYIHRVLASTLIGRKSGAEKCNQLDVFCLYCIHEGRPANIATILLTSFTRVRRGGGSARIALGPYVFRIAQRLRVFDRYPAHFLTRGLLTIPFNLELMRLARMVEQDEPVRWVPTCQFVQVPPPADAPAMEAMQRGAPPHRQHALFRGERPQRDHPLRAPRPDRITLEALWDHIDERLDRSDRALRLLMTHKGIPIPDWFAAPADAAAEPDAAAPQDPPPA